VARGTAMAHLRTGMVIDPVRDLDLGAAGQEDRPILSVCHKPRRPGAARPPAILPSAPPARPPGA
jgi:hypothetical protein